jgi:hypothetical protein
LRHGWIHWYPAYEAVHEMNLESVARQGSGDGGN